MDLPLEASTPPPTSPPQAQVQDCQVLPGSRLPLRHGCRHCPCFVPCQHWYRSRGFRRHAACGATDILTEPSLTIVQVTHIVARSAVFAPAYKFNFPPFMVLVITLLNNGTVMTLGQSCLAINDSG